MRRYVLFALLLLVLTGCGFDPNRDCDIVDPTPYRISIDLDYTPVQEQYQVGDSIRITFSSPQVIEDLNSDHTFEIDSLWLDFYTYAMQLDSGNTDKWLEPGDMSVKLVDSIGFVERHSIWWRLSDVNGDRESSHTIRLNRPGRYALSSSAYNDDEEHNVNLRAGVYRNVRQECRNLIVEVVFDNANSSPEKQEQYVNAPAVTDYVWPPTEGAAQDYLDRGVMIFEMVE